ncbi:hypothetical protein ES703_105961 [subsurface metagenome]
MKLRPESQKLLVELDKRSKRWGPYEVYTGALESAVVGGILPEGAQTRVESCTEEDCSRARSSLQELNFWGFISLRERHDIVTTADFPSKIPVENAQRLWLLKMVVGLTPAGVSYVERLSYPWYRKWWGNIPRDLKALIITVLGVIIATLLIYYFIPLD